MQLFRGLAAPRKFKNAKVSDLKVRNKAKATYLNKNLLGMRQNNIYINDSL